MRVMYWRGGRGDPPIRLILPSTPTPTPGKVNGKEARRMGRTRCSAADRRFVLGCPREREREGREMEMEIDALPSLLLRDAISLDHRHGVVGRRICGNGSRFSWIEVDWTGTRTGTGTGTRTGAGSEDSVGCGAMEEGIGGAVDELFLQMRVLGKRGRGSGRRGG
jgi:hypothetical protein